MSDSDKKHRPIRSFAIRSGRMTDSQRQGLNAHLEQWGLSKAETPIDLSAQFGNSNPVALEIGFGMGDSLAQMAAAKPDWNFIGIEVHLPGIGRLLSLAEKQGLTNIRVFHDDAVAILQTSIAEHSLQRINIYFPDPWHKTKHHKRRLIQPAFIQLLRSRLACDGLLHIATDWQPYAEHILAVMQQQQLFENVAGDKQFVLAADYDRTETKFERRGRRLGHGVWDMVYRAIPANMVDGDKQ